MFPEAEVFTDAGADYFYRAFIDREEVAQKVSKEVREIDYDNFKSSVPDQALHNCYLGFWGLMYKLQETALPRTAEK